MANAVLRGKPDAGNPHVRFDEGEVASCIAAIETEGRNSPSIAQGLPKLRRVHCRRQPEGRASVCAATPRRGSLLYKNIRVFACALPVAACAVAVEGISFDRLSPVDAAAFSVARADKDGDRGYRFTEKSGTHAREIVVVPGDGLKAEAAVVRYPHGGTAERPFVENGKIYLTFAPGETLSLAWPKGGADKAATSAALPLRLPEIVGREQPARVVRREVVKQDGGAALAGAARPVDLRALLKPGPTSLRRRATISFPEMRGSSPLSI